MGRIAQHFLLETSAIGFLTFHTAPVQFHEKGRKMTASPRLGRTLRLLRDSTAGLALTALLTVAMPAVFPDDRAEAAAGNSITAKVAVNIRSGPGTDHSRLGVLYRGESLTVRGSASNGWIPVTWRGEKAWVAAAYVATAQEVRESASRPGASGSAWTTTRLNARSAPRLTGSIQTVLSKSTQVTLTGQVSGQWSQITWGDGTAWVASRYLSSTEPTQSTSPTPRPESVSPTTTPETIGSRWATSDLNLWTGTSGNRFAGMAPKGSEVKVTGTVSGGRAQIVWQGAVRWVTARYLSETAPTASSSGGGGETCQASFYSDDSATASGESFDQWAMKAAHKSLPFGTKLRVMNLSNGKTVDVTVNDRGPYVSGRCLDLTTGAFKAIADTRQGVAKISYQIIS